MSFDVFFQGFTAGESSERGGPEMAKVLRPHVTESRGSFLQVQIGDGAADVYLSEDSMVASHISGHDVWDLLVRGAQAANWVILPMDCPTCLTAPGQLDVLTHRVVDASQDGAGVPTTASWAHPRGVTYESLWSNSVVPGRWNLPSVPRCPARRMPGVSPVMPHSFANSRMSKFGSRYAST